MERVDRPRKSLPQGMTLPDLALRFILNNPMCPRRSGHAQKRPCSFEYRRDSGRAAWQSLLAELKQQTCLGRTGVVVAVKEFKVEVWKSK